jgi:hypothetical protein
MRLKRFFKALNDGNPNPRAMIVQMESRFEFIGLLDQADAATTVGKAGKDTKVLRVELNM